MATQDPSTMKLCLVTEKTPELAGIKEQIFPLIKTLTLVKSLKDRVQQHPKKSSIIFKSLEATEFAVAYVIHNQDGKSCKYINQHDLKLWEIKETELHRLAVQNLERHVNETAVKNGALFRETQTGVFVFNKLGNFSSALILLPTAFTNIISQQKNIVIQMPRSDLLLSADSCDAMSTCAMGEMSLRFVSCEKFLSLQPVKCMNGWLPYEPIKTEHQFPIPRNKDEIKIYKKAIFKK